MQNLIRKKINDGKKAIGTFFELGSALVVECLGRTGFDYIIIDMEHGPFGTESAMEYIRAAELAGITPFVRVSDISRPAVLKMLDAGAKGLIVPCVESVEDVRQLVRLAKFHPQGQRGFCHCRSTGWGFDSFAENIGDYMKTSNEQILLIPQCETRPALEKIEEIAGIDGVDGVFIGPYDLSISLGKPAMFDDFEIKEAIIRVLKACKKEKKMSFIFANDINDVPLYYNQGFDSVTYSMDAALLIKACADSIKKAGVGIE